MARKPDRPIARQIGALIPEVTRASFEKYGFAYADLVSKWEMIMGQTLSRQCAPIKITWPRGLKHENERVSGTLHLACLSAYALDLQHQQAQIIDKINHFYGYQAVSGIHFSQTSRLTKSSQKPDRLPTLEDDEKTRLKESLPPISDPGLSGALESLGENMMRAQKKNKKR